jgi:hypothetical protein
MSIFDYELTITINGGVLLIFLLVGMFLSMIYISKK